MPSPPCQDTGWRQMLAWEQRCSSRSSTCRNKLSRLIKACARPKIGWSGRDAAGSGRLASGVVNVQLSHNRANRLMRPGRGGIHQCSNQFIADDICTGYVHPQRCATLSRFRHGRHNVKLNIDLAHIDAQGPSSQRLMKAVQAILSLKRLQLTASKSGRYDHLSSEI